MSKVTPWKEFENTLPEHEKTPGWDWRAACPAWTFNRLYPLYRDWDRVGPAPPFVMLELTNRKASQKIARAWDDVATGLFYYRDWTADGLPIIRAGEHYCSGFWFQKMADALVFRLAHGGIASWDPDYDQKQQEMDERLRS